jgi:phytoene dehydrogenase-like protein
MTARLHVVGAGLAGLASATAATACGMRVVLHEAAGHAGGRCRSFHDDALGTVIDNGTHLMLGVNRTALAFARQVGGIAAMTPYPARFPFLDVASGERWTLTAAGLAAHPWEMLKACGLPWCPEAQTVAARLGGSAQFRRVWEPLCVAALNTDADEASARLFARLLRAALAGGGASLRPWVFPQGLSAALVDPAVAALRAAGAELRFRHRLLRIEERVLVFDDGPLPLEADDRVVLALPAWGLGQVTDLPVPALAPRAIVNAHFRLDHPPALAGGRPFLGVTGGISQWLAQRGPVISVTVSAADRLARDSNATIAARLWREVAAAIGRPNLACPPVRVMKERRATIVHTPDSVRRRPPPRTPWAHVFLAGDWLAGPWPCTIEAAISSGLAAARMASGRPDLCFRS